MARIDRLEITKIIIAPAITLFIAIIGWVLTTKYNTTQLDVARQRGDADIEIARINAAMRYMEFLRNIPEENAAQRRQAVTIAAPVLPPDLAFRLAINELPDNPAALDTLMPKYGDAAYTYLTKYLEVPFKDLKRVLEPIPEAGPFATQPADSERHADALLSYLRERAYSQKFFNHIVSGGYANNEFRATALLLYFDDYRRSLRDNAGYVVQQAYERVRAEEEFRSYMRDQSLSAQAKQAIAFAASVVFGQRHERQSDIFIREAAERFWDGIDVARGATPVEGSLKSYLYERVFHYNYPPGTDDWYRRDAVDLASASLRDAIRRLNMQELDFDKVRLLFYAYMASPTVARDPAYLAPADAFEVTRKVLDWANSPQKQQNLSMELGSLSGEQLFLNMLPSSYPRQDRARMQPQDVRTLCSIAKSFVEMLIEWYRKHYANDWYIPKFFYEAANEFPDLESRIDRNAWGLGGPSKLETSRGCR